MIWPFKKRPHVTPPAVGFSVGEQHPFALEKPPVDAVQALTRLNGAILIDKWVANPRLDEIADLTRRWEIFGIAENSSYAAVYVFFGFASEGGGIVQPWIASLPRGLDTSTIRSADTAFFLMTVSDTVTDKIHAIRSLGMTCEIRDQLCNAIQKAPIGAQSSSQPSFEELVAQAAIWQFKPSDADKPNPVFEPFANGAMNRIS